MSSRIGDPGADPGLLAIQESSRIGDPGSIVDRQLTRPRKGPCQLIPRSQNSWHTALGGRKRVVNPLELEMMIHRRLLRITLPIDGSTPRFDESYDWMHPKIQKPILLLYKTGSFGKFWVRVLAKVSKTSRIERSPKSVSKFFQTFLAWGPGGPRALATPAEGLRRCHPGRT